MRVAYFVNEFPAISQTFVIGQIAGMLEYGHEVDIYATRPANQKVSLSTIFSGNRATTIFFSEMPANWLGRLFYLASYIGSEKRFKRLLMVIRSIFLGGSLREKLSLRLACSAMQITNEGDYDLIHCQFATLGHHVSDLMKIKGISGRLILSVRGYDITSDRYASSTNYSPVFQLADYVLPVSNSLANRLNELGCDQSKIHVHYSGIDTAKFKLRSPLPESTSIEILSVGRLVEKKGFQYAIKAISFLDKLGYDVSYTIVGEGPLRQNLENDIEQNEVSHLVNLVGARQHDDVLAMMVAADVFLLPCVTAEDGDQEGIPNVLKEAMLIGVPVISTWHSGIPELIENGEEGWLIAEKDIQGIVDSIVCLRQADKKDVRNVIENARNKVLSQFDQQSLNLRLHELYQSLDHKSRTSS